jgi:hypothetical protein
VLRVRFKTKHKDYRPAIWPIQHPYWCSGHGEGYHILLAYVDSIEQLREQWPEAYDLDSEEVTEYQFSSRFPKPDWFKK